MIRYSLCRLFIGSIVGCMLLWCSSCERRPLEDDTLKFAQVRIAVDWSKSGIEPATATVVFYSLDNKSEAPVTTYLYNGRGTVDLKVGTYATIMVNETFDSFDAIAFRGLESYETMQAYLKPIQYPGYIAGAREQTVDNPDMLVSASYDTFVVTEEMLLRSRQEETRKKQSTADTPDILFTPVAVTVQVQMKVHIKNIYLIRRGTQNAIIKGFSEAVWLSTRKPASTAVTQFADLPVANYYDSSVVDGWMEGAFTTFGECTPPAGSERQEVQFILSALLRDKEQTRFLHTSAITDLLKYDKLEMILKISFEIGANAEAGNPPVVVPPIEVEDPNSGFQPNIDDWGEEEEIVKPMN